MSWLGQRPFSLKSALVMRSTATCRPNSEFGARSSAQVCKTRNDEPRRTVLRAVRGILCVSASIRRCHGVHQPIPRFQFVGGSRLADGNFQVVFLGAHRSKTNKFPFSRRAFPAHPSYVEAVPKNHAVLRPSSEPFGRGWTERHHDRAQRTNKRTEIRTRKRNADRRSPQPLAFRQARTLRRARSPVGVPRRFCLRDSRIPKCGFGPGFAERSAYRWRGLSRRRLPRLQRAPRVPVIVPAG